MALIISIKVVPSSGKTGCILDKNGTLKCFLKSHPEKGKANQELIAFFAQLLKIPKKNIDIISGLTSKTKKIALHTHLSMQQFFEILDIPEQTSLFTK